MAATDENFSDSSSSTIKGLTVKKRRHRQEKNNDLEYVKQPAPGEFPHPTSTWRMNNAFDALQLSPSDASRSHHRATTTAIASRTETGDSMQPTVAQPPEREDEYNSDTSTSSGETLKAKQGNSKGGLSFFYEFTRRSHKVPCTPQLQIWAHDSNGANLTLAEILEKANWEGARLERL